MKFGQALSVFEAALPEDARRALPRDADQAAGGRRRRCRRRPGARGPGPRARRRTGATSSVEFDDVPAAAASIGQVHRARLARRPRGRGQGPVPGRRPRPCSSDLNQLARIGRLVGPLGARPGRQAAGRRAARPGSREELDYQLEAGSQRALRRGVPTATPTCSCPTCVVDAPTRCWSPSGSTAPRCRGSSPTARQEERDRRRPAAGPLPVLRPGRAGLLHADPHPGNFRLLDGRPARACSTSARSTGCPTACPRRSAGCCERAAPATPTACSSGPARRGLRPARASTSTPDALLDYLDPVRRAVLERRRSRSPRAWLRGQAARVARPALARVPHRAEAQPAAGVPADPPGLARRHRRALPARWHRAAARDDLRPPARHRRVTPASAPGGLSRAGSPPGRVELPLDAAQVAAAAGVAGPHVATVLDPTGPGDPRQRRRVVIRRRRTARRAHRTWHGCRRPGSRGAAAAHAGQPSARTAALAAFLKSRTFCSDTGSTTSATERNEPGSA